MRDPNFDIIRTFGVIMVISFHLGEAYWGEALFFPASITELFTNWQTVHFNPFFILALIGDMAVPLFLFLSGYLLAIHHTKFSWSWLRHRLRVLLPPYWLAVIVLSTIIYYLWQIAPQFMSQTIAGPFSWDRVIYALLLLQNFTAYTFNSPSPVWWFIPILIQSYLVFAFWSRRISQLTWTKMARETLKLGLLINAAILGLSILFGLQYWAYFSILQYWITVGFGLAWGMRASTSMPHAPRHPGPDPGSPSESPQPKFDRSLSQLASDLQHHPLPYSLLIILLGWFLRLTFSRWFFLSEALIALGWFVLLYSLTQRLSVQSPLTSSLAYIGRVWSYPIYLWHQPLIWVLFAFLFT